MNKIRHIRIVRKRGLDTNRDEYYFGDSQLKDLMKMLTEIQGITKYLTNKMRYVHQHPFGGEVKDLRLRWLAGSNGRSWRRWRWSTPWSLLSVSLAWEKALKSRARKLQGRGTKAWERQHIPLDEKRTSLKFWRFWSLGLGLCVMKGLPNRAVRCGG